MYCVHDLSPLRRSAARATGIALLLLLLVGGTFPPQAWAGDPVVIPYQFSQPWWRDRMLISPCYPYVSCAAYQRLQAQERRRERLDELAREQGQRAAPIPPLRIAPSNPENIRPEFADSGSVREGFEDSGKPLERGPDR